jgi:hypothetical protein
VDAERGVGFTRDSSARGDRFVALLRLADRDGDLDVSVAVPR